MSSLDEGRPRSFQPIIISMKRILSSDERPAGSALNPRL
jgi:hypothetical protein